MRKHKRELSAQQMQTLVAHIEAIHDLGCAVVVVTPDDARVVGVTPQQLHIDAVEERLIELSWDIIRDTAHG